MISKGAAFLDFFFPHFCLSCNERVVQKHFPLCETCLEELPSAASHPEYYQLMERIEGFFPLTEAWADLRYRDDSVEKEIVLRGKYGDEPELLYALASYFATKHKANGHFADVSVVVPIPVAPRRLRKRTYNQSAYIAQAFADVFKLDYFPNLLFRHDTGRESQTKRNKTERWNALKNVFYCGNDSKDLLAKRRVLLVDDVLTTGSTLVHAGRTLYKETAAESLSVYALATDVF